MANLPVSPVSPRDLGKALSDLRTRIQAQVEATPQLRLPAVRWAIAALAGLLLLGIASAFFVLYLMFAPLQLPEPLEGSRAATTQILGADGSVIEQWHGPINRTFVELSQVSEHLQDAAVAAEDARFYRRGAVDLRAALRALRENLMSGSVVQGGSTISQQYAKNVYVGNARTIGRKIHEARVAYRLERELGKAKVLEGYLNTVYFGRGAYGVEAASKIYFGKPASDVTVSEAALLIGMIKSPNAYSPYDHPVRAELRRTWVIERMKKVGLIDGGQAREAVEQVPVLTPAGEAHPEYGWYLDAVRTYLLRKYGAETVYSGGLRVQTAIDPQAQEAAESTIANALPGKSDPYAALASIDPATGYVKALVGGRDYTDERYNIALQGRRQPGSAFKPLVLVAALESGIPVSAGYRAPGRICPKAWRPSCVSNYGGSGYGWMNLERATVHSVNTVYAQLILEVGPERVVDVARRMGIPGPAWMPPRSGCRQTAEDSCATRLQPLPAMALGSEEVTPLELASVYATLAAGGLYREPKLVTRVTDGQGRVLEEGPSEPVRAISPEVAETVNQVLTRAVEQGTGTRARYGGPAAGKTGTAQDFSNAWFSGYSPNLATALWVGHRNSNQPLVNVQGVRRVAGGTLPAEMWGEYMKGVSDRTPPVLELDRSLEDAAYVSDPELALEGRASDVDGTVQGVEVSIDGGPFAAAGVTCSGCPGAEVRWRYRSPAPFADGAHVVAVRSHDKAGHRSEPRQIRFTVDTRPPALERAQATGGAAGVDLVLDEPVDCESVVPGSFSVLVGGSRARLASTECAGASAAQVRLVLASPVRGGDLVTIGVARSARAPVDRAGNPAVSEPVRTTASNTGPAVRLQEGSGDAPFPARGVEIAGSAEDPDGTLEEVTVSVDGGPFSAAGITCPRCGRDAAAEWSYRPARPLIHGEHVIEFRAGDNAGAVSEPRRRKVTVDAVAPALEAVAASGGDPQVKVGFGEPVSCAGTGAAGFSVSAGGTRSRVLSVACSGEASMVLELTLAQPVAGGDRVSVSVLRSSQAPADRAGNPAEPITRSAEATNRAPVLELASDVPGAPVAPSRVEAAGTIVDPDGTVEKVEVSVDGRPFSTAGVDCTGCGRRGEVEWSYSPRPALGNGRHELAFRGVDNAGRASSVRSIAVVVDSVAPSVREVRAQGGSPVVELVFGEPVECSPAAARQFRASVAGRRTPVQAAGCEGALVRLTLARVPEGGEQVHVVLQVPTRSRRGVTDAAGNPAAAGTTTVAATNRSPLVEIPAEVRDRFAAGSRRPGDVVRLEGTASDPDGTVELVEWSAAPGGPFSRRGVTCRGCGRSGEVSFTVEVRVPEEGLSGLAVRAGDSAGSFSAPAEIGQVEGSRAPALESVSARGGSSSVTAVFSEPVDCASVDRTDLVVTVAGRSRPVLAVDCPGDSQERIGIRITGRLKTSESVSVRVAGTLRDPAGNRVRAGSAGRTEAA